MSAGKIITGIGVSLIVFTFFMSFNVMATNFSVYDEENHHYDELIPGEPGIDGKDGLNGIDGIGIKGDSGNDGIDGLLFNDNRLSRGIAITGAMSMIPALSHVGVHNHSG